MRIDLSSKYGFETTAIHADSIAKLLRKGANHLKNEVASKIQAKIERDPRSGIVLKTKDVAGDSTEVKKAKLEAFRKDFGSVVDAWYDEAEGALVAELTSGAYAAEREPGETKRLTELEREVRSIAKEELEAKLGQRPKLTDELIVNNKAMTYEALIESYVGGTHKARLEKEGQKVLDARKARAARAGKADTGKAEDGKVTVTMEF